MMKMKSLVLAEIDPRVCVYCNDFDACEWDSYHERY